MRYSYRALDPDGSRVTGTLDAPTQAEALDALRQRGLFPTGVQEDAALAASAPGDARRFPWPITSTDRALFLNQLSLMLRSGLTLLGALEALTKNASKPGLRACARRLGVAVREGKSLSVAFGEERHFPPVIARLASTAEATGELEQAFTRGAELIERRAELQRQLIASLTYPTIVVLAATGVFVFLTTQVVPKFASLLAQRGVALPWTTQTLLDVSSFLVNYGPWVGLGAALLGLALFVAWRTGPGRRALERGLFAVPVLGSVLQAAAMTHLMRTLSLLLQSGLPLLESLQALATTAPFLCFQDLIARARQAVVRGASLAKAFEDPLFPALGGSVLAVGEETGSLEEVTGELGEHYERRLQSLLRTLSSLIEPALLIVIGGMVGFVYFSFFQAVFRVAAR
ncbi:MAG: type II secretion system F family protein [Planctomycetota bacterium]